MTSILVVDDDELVRRAIVRILAGAGYELQEASDGDEAWQMQTAQPFDLILTDLYMPNADGIEFLTRLQEIDSETKVIAISGGGRIVGHANALEDAEAFGASATLRKPFTPTEVLEKVQEVLEQD